MLKSFDEAAVWAARIMAMSGEEIFALSQEYEVSSDKDERMLYRDLLFRASERNHQPAMWDFVNQFETDEMSRWVVEFTLRDLHHLDDLDAFFYVLQLNVNIQ